MKMPDRLRVAVVGAGFMGELHARTYAECDSAELVAIADPNVEVGLDVAKNYGARHVADVQDLLDDGNVHAFTVALPDRMHVEVTSRILEAGKAVLLEKPMADTLEGARRIAEAEQRGGGRLMVGHILRFDPRYVGAAEAVANGQVGDPVHITGTRFSPREVGERLAGSSSVCFYLGVHDVDAIQWVTGKRVSSVYSRAVSKIMPLAGVDSEDSIFSTCEFEDGSIGALHFGWSVPPYMPSAINARLEVFCTEGVIKLDVHDHGLHVIAPSGITLPDGLHWPEVNGRIRGDLAAEVLHFVTSVRDDQEFVVSVPEAMRAVAVNDAILRSVESGRPESVEKV
jgi:predicted dehydrogenase